MLCPLGNAGIAGRVTEARMLVQMGRVPGLSPQAPRSEGTRILKDLHVARSGLIKGRTRLHNRAQTQDIAILWRQTKARILQVERQIAELNAEIANLVASQEVAARTLDILCSIPDFGKVTHLKLDSKVPDNLKIAVIKADRSDPSLNRTYAGMATYYGTAILPAQPNCRRAKPMIIAHRLNLQRDIPRRYSGYTKNLFLDFSYLANCEGSPEEGYPPQNTKFRRPGRKHETHERSCAANDSALRIGRRSGSGRC